MSEERQQGIVKGSTPKRATASSPRKMAMICSYITRKSRAAATAVSMKAPAWNSPPLKDGAACKPVPSP